MYYIFLNVISSATRKLFCTNSYLCNHAVKSRTQTHSTSQRRPVRRSKRPRNESFLLFILWNSPSGQWPVASGWVTVWSQFEPRATAAFSDQGHPALFEIVCGVTSRTLQLAIFLLLRHNFSWYSNNTRTPGPCSPECSCGRVDETSSRAAVMHDRAQASERHETCGGNTTGRDRD